MIELFSNDFTREIWGKHAAELSTSRILFTEADVLSALRQYALRPQQIREVNSQSEAITAFNGKRTSEPRVDFLPSEDDATLEDYVTRIDRLAGDDEWAVMYYGLYAASSTMWDAAKEFSDRLALAIGYRPGGRVDIDCFIGRYSSTYIGVHVDHAHNFAFTLRNGKTMFTWPGNRVDLLWKRFPDYEPFKYEGTPLSNKTDRVAYFPEDCPHVAETKDEVSVNVNIAFWETGNDTHLNANYVKSCLIAPNKTRHDVRSSGLAALNPDDEFMLSSLKAMLDGNFIKKRMMIAQLISDTSGRLNLGRPLIDVDEVDDEIAINPISTLQWSPWRETSEILVSANGHCASFLYSEELQNVLRPLCNGDKVNIFVLANHRDERLSEEVLRVVRALAGWGAL
ncbi:hypothetical protein D5038_19250 [Verminephrobacter aporrectodeae subsp. tuberculatae]|uniref:hypothetical protein n=1 Tax=Verminephrobacter aporrectodeae TaxID=1110389 RepID=UPI0022389553|nr:hypothetical protein [Verminephrobacter aporrectodeae]MCW5258405.1 hypothetical protein [Verminephrobacter aporrectodeae subsp. tuberculatae]